MNDINEKYIPKKLGYDKIYHYALQLFGYDREKTNLWWMTKNEQLDGLSPFEMIKEGKGRQLMKLIIRCI